MKILLDENVTDEAQRCLGKLGYDVESIKTLGKLSISDEEVFKLATEQNRILITHNGKHFIIQIPPRKLGIQHKGLIWLKYQMTRNNAEELCKIIHDLLKYTCISNSIYILRMDSDHELELVRRFPS